MSSDGQPSAAAKNTREISIENRVAMPSVFSTAGMSLLPQYCAARMVVPMVSAEKNRFSTN